MAWLRNKLHNARYFFSAEIWQTRLDTLPRGRALRYGAARIASRTANALFANDVLPVRAAALTYFTVLSIVPLLAFVFAILKGFGAYDVLIEETIRPYVIDTFRGNPALQDAFEQILVFVSETGVASLGFLGLVTLLYTATRLLRNIEIAMNEIWGAQSGRGLLRQVTDYAAILMVTPICLLLAAGLGTATQLIDALRNVAQWVGLGGVLDLALGLFGPLLVITLGLFVLYEIMPNTGVRYRSALVGAVVGGLLWYVALIIHVRFQVGVAKFNALYSSFAVIPIFLVWVYMSWLMVLVGAQVASSHQHVQVIAQRKRSEPVTQQLREAVALSLLLKIAQAFMEGAHPPSESELQDAADAEGLLLDEILACLVEAHLVVRTQDGEQPGYMIARPPADIHVKDVLDALRGTHRQTDPHEPSVAEPTAVHALQALDHEIAYSRHNLTLAELLRDRSAVHPSGKSREQEIA